MPMAIPSGGSGIRNTEAMAVVRLMAGPTERSMPPTRMTASWPRETISKRRELDGEVGHIALGEEIGRLAGGISGDRHGHRQQEEHGAVAPERQRQRPDSAPAA